VNDMFSVSLSVICLNQSHHYCLSTGLSRYPAIPILVAVAQINAQSQGTNPELDCSSVSG
jgi:hypothetical protein